jgi:uncharacterized Zn finger protein (UPF0148 family)
MIAKFCPRCKKNSYSAATQGKWVCPYCDKDLTYVKSRPTERANQAELKLIKNHVITLNK